MTFLALSLALRLNAVVMECMSTHEVDGWQCKFLLTEGALFLVECFSIGTDLNYLGLHFPDLLHVLVDLFATLLDDLILSA